MNECPLCKGQKYQIVENKVVDCECLRRKTIIDVYKSAGIPLEFVDSNMEQFYRHVDADHKDLSPTDEKQKMKARNAVQSFIQQIPSMAEGHPFSQPHERWCLRGHGGAGKESRPAGRLQEREISPRGHHREGELEAGGEASHHGMGEHHRQLLQLRKRGRLR